MESIKYYSQFSHQRLSFIQLFRLSNFLPNETLKEMYREESSKVCR